MDKAIGPVSDTLIVGQFGRGLREDMIGAAGDMGEAWINGAPVGFDEAVAEAERLIRASALPVIAHLGADVEGAREAVLLAECAGGALDHAASEAMLRDLDPLRESGAMLTTPLEAAVRADVVLLIGSVTAPDWLDRPARPYDEDIARRVIRLDQGSLSFLAALRARIKQRRIASTPAGAEEMAEALRSAKFGVALWSAAELAPLAIEAIHGLVRDLNETTRFSTLAAPSPDNGLGVQTVCGWMTGFPLRTGFARGRPQHDPWRYDARRLVASGEADCVIWVSALAEGALPSRPVDIALSAADAPARVRFAVARPGLDSDAILYDNGVGTLVAMSASATSQRPTVGATLAAIRARLERSSC
jgi:formylmethanofuran dehydrogenase subunit B